MATEIQLKVLHVVRTACVCVSKVMLETRRGRESRRGTAENETLLTAQRSWRVSKSGRRGERAKEESKSEKRT